jgi:hypothetical protein
MNRLLLPYSHGEPVFKLALDFNIEVQHRVDGGAFPPVS